MIYTCYEMIRDCRADKPEGWLHFISNYIPVVRQVAAHYAPGAAVDTDGIVKFLRKPDSQLFQLLEPAPERWFVAELRQNVIAQLPPQAAGAAASPVDLETLSDAFQPLTLTEKQAVWLEAMLYPAAEAGPMLRMAPATVDKIRERGAELLRGKLDLWNRQILAENGRGLGAAAAAGASAKDCLPAKVFLDILDGRMPWRGREEMEQHVLGCWHCIDRFCRMVEVIHFLRIVKPLEESEAQPYRELLGVAAKKRRWF